jgi:prepilin-type N-terminal cleavage/methylation domain-containing protein
MLESLKENLTKEHERGYTLIEVLITILIMGMILLMINVVLMSLIRVAYDTDARMNIRQDVEFSIEVIRRNLKSASPSQITVDDDGNINLEIAGDGGEVTFSRLETGDDNTGYIQAHWIDRDRRINLTSKDEVNVTNFDVDYNINDASGTGELILTIEAQTVQKKTNGDPVVSDFFKQVSIVTKGKEL